MKTIPFILTLCLLSILLSCGKKMAETESSNIREDETDHDIEGMYVAKLTPLNMSVTGSTVGEFKVRILGDEVRVRGEVENSPPVPHRQYIHNGPDCPGPGADADLDGIISERESMAITGRRIMSLDPFPVPGALGAYTYFESSSLIRMMSSMDMSDKELKLSRRTIVIYGAQGDSSLPIACGTFVREG